MKEFLEKISSYNIFNNLLPGILFVVIAKEVTSFSFLRDNILEGAFVYYFVGLLISRLGSLIIEPLMKELKIVEFAEYKDYIAACKEDDKLDTLSEVNNTFRTLSAVFLFLIILKAYDYFRIEWQISYQLQTYGFLILVLLVFISAYKKQTNYVVKRINSYKKT